MPEILPGAGRLNNPKLLDQVRAAVRFNHYSPRRSRFMWIRSSDSMKYWEIIADHLGKTGWSWGCVSAVDSNRRTIFVDAHRDGQRFVVRADEKLTAFVELESAIRG